MYVDNYRQLVMILWFLAKYEDDEDEMNIVMNIVNV